MERALRDGLVGGERRPVELTLPDVGEEADLAGAGGHRAAAGGEDVAQVVIEGDDRTPDRPPRVARRPIVDELLPKRRVDAVGTDDKVGLNAERRRRLAVKVREDAAIAGRLEGGKTAVKVNAIFWQPRGERALQPRPADVDHGVAARLGESSGITCRIGKLGLAVGGRDLDGIG